MDYSNLSPAPVTSETLRAVLEAFRREMAQGIRLPPPCPHCVRRHAIWARSRLREERRELEERIDREQHQPARWERCARKWAGKHRKTP